MVDLITNRDDFEDVYPSDSDSEDSDVPMDDADDIDEPSNVTKALARESIHNGDSMKKAKEEKASATSRLAMLENYGRSFDKDRPKDLEAVIEAYRAERQKAFYVHFASEARIKTLERERANLQKKQSVNLRDAAKVRKIYQGTFQEA